MRDSRPPEAMAATQGLLVTLAGGAVGQVIAAIQLALGDRVDPRFYSLPKVIVIGSECSGKSSLLENITQQEFFPKGERQTTRTPVVLNVNPCNAEEHPTFSIEYLGQPPQVLHSAIQVLEAVNGLMPDQGIHSEEITVNVNGVSYVEYAAAAKKSAMHDDCVDCGS